jgi:hypothetical protein
MLFSIGLAASTLPMLVVAGMLYRAGAFTSAQSPQVALAAAPAADQPTVPAAKAELRDDTALTGAVREDVSAALHRHPENNPGGRQAKGAPTDIDVVAPAGSPSGAEPEGASALHRHPENNPEDWHAKGAPVDIDVVAPADSSSEVDRTAAARQALAAPDAKEARRRTEQDAWTEAAVSGTQEAYRGYLDAYPKGDNAAKARQALAALAAADDQRQRRDDLAWSGAQQRNTKASFAAYLLAYPAGRHADAARARLAELERLELRPPSSAPTKAPAQAEPKARAPGALGPKLWPSADEPSSSADRRIGPH